MKKYDLIERLLGKKKDDFIETLLGNFVFKDCRLKEHPKIRARLFWKEGDQLVLREGVDSPRRYILSENANTALLNAVYNQRGYALNFEREDFKTNIQPRIKTPRLRSFLGVPLINGKETIGVLSFDSVASGYFAERDLGHAQLLSAILVYSRINPRIPSSVTTQLGIALKRIREELGFTQSDLAEKLAQSRIAISRWESGTQPPSRGVLYKWCEALQLFSANHSSIVTIVDVTPELIRLLKDNPSHLRELSPSQFEGFVANRLDRMGFDVTLTGSTTHKDGGIDLIAVPKIRTVGAFILAAQVKHHQASRKTGRDAVDRLLAWKDSPFRLGLLVTNTEFTKDAKWVAEQNNNRAFIRLRDFSDLKRWIEDNFWSQEDWVEIPDEIILAPGVTVPIPKPRLKNSLDIWNIPKIE